MLPGNHAVRCTDPPSGLLAGAVVFRRLEDKFSHEAVRKALPLVGNILDIGFNSDNKLQVFVSLFIRHERLYGALRHYDIGVTMW